MAGKWKTPEETRPGFIRLAELALRAERILVARRLETIRALVTSHTKALRRHPGGHEKLEEAQQYLNQAKQLLRGKPHG